MDTNIIPFSFDGQEVRIVMQSDEPWWVLAYVCKACGIGNSRMVADRLDDDQKGVSTIDTLGGPQKLNVVNESGLYDVILDSRKPEARRFRKWVTSEVLPSIRKHGGYMAGQETMSPEQMALAGMRWLESKVAEQQQQLEAQAPKVLWADALTTSSKAILIGEMAKILNQNGVDTGQTRFFQWLRANGYLMKRNGVPNMPTQKSMNLKLFEVKETPIVHADGHTTVSFTTKVTPRGQQYFIRKFLASKAGEL